MYKAACKLESTAAGGDPYRVTTRQRSGKTFYPSRPNSDRYARSYIYQGATQWNQLPGGIREIGTVDRFRTILKRRLLEAERAEYIEDEN